MIVEHIRLVTAERDRVKAQKTKNQMERLVEDLIQEGIIIIIIIISLFYFLDPGGDGQRCLRQLGWCWQAVAGEASGLQPLHGLYHA